MDEELAREDGEGEAGPAEEGVLRPEVGRAPDENAQEAEEELDDEMYQYLDVKDYNRAFLSKISCEFICKQRLGGQNVMSAMQAPMGDGGLLSAVLDGVAKKRTRSE